ncbi:hypothetical protein evm_008577 [Chilo suppressalis]|nr:hypothetical protein evm_008577 [Chilo suppressalis]
MRILIALILATTAACQRATERVEDVENVITDPSQNTTTLYPVSNTTANLTVNDDNPQPQQTEKSKNSDVALWKIDTAYNESGGDKKEENSKESGEANTTVAAGKEFKPSPHLGTIIEEDNFYVTPTKATFGDFKPLKKPPTGFLSFSKDQFKSNLHHQDLYRQHNGFPYKIQSSGFNKVKDNWRPFDLESKPTVEAPMKLPAGGLYRSPDAFKEKPATSDDDFGLDFNDLKENKHVRKRMNPWKSLLHLVTSLIPVGLIVSALTPSIITVHPADPANQYSSFRRSDAGIDELAPISEACRRRLLCELHSNTNYMVIQTGRRKARQCFKIRCEDPQALSKMLQWLLSQHQSTGRGQHLT